MMAIQAGAAHVYTCEMRPLIARLARDVIAANGMSERITVINRLSTDVRVNASASARDVAATGQLPQRVDVIVSELLESQVLGEGVVPNMRDALARLAVPRSRCVPARVQVWAS